MATERHDPATGRLTTGHEWNGIEELETPIPRIVFFFLVVTALFVRAGGFKRPGLVAGVFGVGYGLARIASEFFREPDPQLEALAHGLTMGMVLSAPMIVIGLWLIVRSGKAEEARP